MRRKYGFYDKVVTLRLPQYLIDGLSRKFPDLSMSEAIRTCIYLVLKEK